MPNKDTIIYFDNAATSWPKPQIVSDYILNFLANYSGNPGRSGHKLATAADEIIFDCRQKIAKLFNIQKCQNVIFTQNCTMAMNIAILGVLEARDHVITSSIEHNSTIRPLEALKNQKNIAYSTWQLSLNNEPNLDDFKQLIKPETKLVIINHSSNVNGMILPIKEIGEICAQYGLIFLVDGAQSAGTIDIDMKREKIDILAIAGHKGLLGPTGSGILVINDTFDHQKIKPIIFGGTGSLSTEFIQPDFLPDKLESGTLNTLAIAGLNRSIDYLLSHNQNEILYKKQLLVNTFLELSTKEFGDRIVHYNHPSLPNSGVCSFNISDFDCTELAFELSESYNIMSRAGLHCAPLAHQTLGSYPKGTIRFSFGNSNTISEIEFAINSLKTIIQ